MRTASCPHRYCPPHEDRDRSKCKGVALSPNERIALPDVQALLRLCNRLHEAEREPASRKRRLLDELCALADADGATTEVASFEPGARGPAMISVVNSS